MMMAKQEPKLVTLRMPGAAATRRSPIFTSTRLSALATAFQRTFCSESERNASRKRPARRLSVEISSTVATVERVHEGAPQGRRSAARDPWRGRVDREPEVAGDRGQSRVRVDVDRLLEGSGVAGRDVGGEGHRAGDLLGGILGEREHRLPEEI